PDWTGNYYQSGDEWEREMNIEFYETDNTGFNQNAGLRTHGGNSRRERQKGMKIYARKEYGKKNFKYKMFEDKDITSFKRFVFKPFVCSWTDSGIQDYVCCHLASNLNIDCIATRPVVMYINGEYYGVYFIQERIDKNYLEENFDVDGDDCNMMDNWFGDINEGDNTQFLSLIDWVYEADLSDTSSYNYMCDKINIDNFIDYQIFEIFIANLDWPANNMRCWQKDDNGEWRWIFYDGDAGMIDLKFDAFTNALYNDSTPGTWPSSNTQSTLFLRKLIENDTFKVNFINRFNNLLSTTFQYDSISPYIAECSGLIENEIQGQLYRFNKPASYDSWLDAIDDTYNFIQSRAKDVSEQIIELWGGISDKQLFRFKCYPNPSSNSFNILYDNISDENSTTLAIYDISGQCVFTRTVSCNFGLNILSVDTELPDGIYFIQFGNSYLKHIIQ
ncbi:MAG: CotH kinase family protein, partial [Bacteroidales bacterium]|nr:CotH kinase family protein [Bacteroidales bacterium]